MNPIGVLLQETAEAKFSETPLIPKFFDALKESSDTVDTPVAEIETTENPTIYLITRNESLAGDIHPITGVPFERQTIELGTGEIIEGVFPIFGSTYDANISEDLFTESDYKQFKECNKQLLEAMETDPELKSKFSTEQLEQIKDGIYDGSAPDGYIWHHAPQPGLIQLVDANSHAGTGHTGGRTVWGGGNENR